MNLIFLINDNYAEQFAVTLTSLLINLKTDDDINIFILNTNLSKKNQDKLNKIKFSKKCKFNFITVDESEFKDLPKISHLKTMNYVRLLFPSLINCDKALYLDSDILVFKDLCEFYNTSFEDNYAVVVKDRWSNSFQLQSQMEKFGIKRYFNAGVMLLNLKKMREDSIENKCLEFIKENVKSILFLEQCVLNKIFSNNVKYVDKTYNFQFKLNISEEVYKDFYKQNGWPHIVHFVGYEKPFEGFSHPFEKEYFKTLKRTPYKISYFNFKKRMWKKLCQKLRRKIVIIVKSMIL